MRASTDDGRAQHIYALQLRCVWKEERKFLVWKPEEKDPLVHVACVSAVYGQSDELRRRATKKGKHLLDDGGMAEVIQALLPGAADGACRHTERA